MLRAMWTGDITFGLVTVPVKAYKAEKSHDLEAKQLHNRDNGRITLRRFCSLCGDELPWSDLVMGYPAGGDRYVVIAPEEMAALAPGMAKGFKIDRFVPVGAIKPFWLESSYLLAPAPGGANAYAVLVATMQGEGVAGVGRMYMRDRVYVAALFAENNLLTLATLLYADEVLQRDELPGYVGSMVSPGIKEIAAARQLIKLQSGPFEHEAYRDEFRDALQELVEQRAAAAVTVPAKSEKAGDLTAALQASIDALKPAPSVRRRRTTAEPKPRTHPKQGARAPLVQPPPFAAEPDQLELPAPSAGDLDT